MRARLAGTVATAVAFTAALAVAAGSMINQPVNSSQGQFTSASTTICAVQNTSGYPREIIDLKVLYTSTTAAASGAIQILVGTSTGNWVTSTSPFINTTVTPLNGMDIVATTSTIHGTGAVYPVWRTSEWLNFWSSTTVNSGYCAVSWL